MSFLYFFSPHFSLALWYWNIHPGLGVSDLLRISTQKSHSETVSRIHLKKKKSNKYLIEILTIPSPKSKGKYPVKEGNFQKPRLREQMVGTPEFSVIYPTPDLHNFPAPTKESPMSFPAPDLFSCSWTLGRWEWNISFIQRWKLSLWNELPQNIPAKDTQTLWRYFAWGFRSRICKSPGHYYSTSPLCYPAHFSWETLSAQVLPSFVGGWHPQFK